MHYRRQLLCRVPAALGKGTIALGKGFAECRTRQRPLAKICVGKELFAECHLSSTRQRLCRVLSRLSAKKRHRHGSSTANGGFAECLPSRHSAKKTIFFKKILYLVSFYKTLGKEMIFFKTIFAECLL